jgi:predicted DNA-binding antitoxin AbrB/MazE fold protein
VSDVIHATVLDGVLKPDVPLLLPNGSRVRVQVESVTPTAAAEKDPFEVFVAYTKQHPVFSDGAKLNREELYDRG